MTTTTTGIANKVMKKLWEQLASIPNDLSSFHFNEVVVDCVIGVISNTKLRITIIKL